MPTEQPAFPCSVAEYAAARQVHRRTVLIWIRREYLLARRKGHGPTSPWLILREIRQPTTYYEEVAARQRRDSQQPNRLNHLIDIMQQRAGPSKLVASGRKAKDS